MYRAVIDKASTIKLGQELGLGTANVDFNFELWKTNVEIQL